MIGFPLALNQEHTGKVIAPAIITGSCIQLLGTSPDVVADYVGPFLLPAGDLHGPGSYISYVNTGGSWIGTAELVDFGGNVIATATVSGAGTGFIQVPFDNNVNIPSDTLCYLRFTNTDSGAGVLTWYFEVVRAGALPMITTPPVVSWTVEIGQSPTLTDPVYTGDPDTITWTLYRDGVADGTIVNVDKATAEAYAAVAADIGPDLYFEATVTNGSGTDSDVTNTVVFDDASYLPSARIWVSDAGLVLADSDTTVDSWTSSLGGGSAATQTASDASARPAYGAMGGTGGRPLVTSDGVSDRLSNASIGAGSAEIGVVMPAAWTTTGDRRIVSVGGGAAAITINTLSASTVRSYYGGSFSSSAAASWPSYIHARHDGTNLISAQGGTDLASTAISAVSVSAGVGLFSYYSTGALYGGGGAQAFVVSTLLSSTQRTHLRALLTYHTGVSC